MLADKQRKAIEWCVLILRERKNPVADDFAETLRGMLTASAAPAEGREADVMVYLGGQREPHSISFDDAEERQAVDARAAVRAMSDVLLAAWQKAEPTHSITQYPESYKATFMDMARAAVANAPAKPSEGQVHAITDWPGYWIDGQKVSPQDYIAWLLKQLEATEAARLPEPKYYGTQEGEGAQHEVKCAYVDGWNDCRKAMPTTAPAMSEGALTIYDQRTLVDEQMRNAAPQLFCALKKLLEAVEERPDRMGIESVTLSDAHAAIDRANAGEGKST